MKKLLYYLSLSFLVVFSFTACEVDPTGPGTGGPGTGGPGTGGTDTGPTLLVITETGFVNDIATVNIGEEFFVKIQGEKGDSDLQAITIYENGSAIESSRITDGGNTVAANPFLILGGDVTSFVKELGIIAHDVEGERTFEIELRDINGNVDSETISITTLPAMVDPPTITVGGSGMYMSQPSSIVTVPVSVSNVSSPLLVIGVFEGDEPVDPSRLWWDDLSNPNWPENPGAVQDADQLGFDRTIFIRSHAEGVQEYTIAIADATGEQYLQTFTIDVGSVTPVTTLEGILFNRAGPAGTGGLDLDTGASTGSMDPEAEIKDEGIDISLPNSTNWIRRISGTNDAQVRELKPLQNGLPENFTFAGINSQEEIQSIWANGILFEMNSNGDLTSNFVEVGNVFIVERQGKFYVIEIIEINETQDNNNDNYVIDIKF